jgi:hypothetical protein
MQRLRSSLAAAALAAASALSCVTSLPAQAGTLFLSGDANLGTPLMGTPLYSIDAGNRRFFDNLLQGGDRVLVTPVSAGLATIGVTSPPLIVDYYNTRPGVSASLFSGAITTQALAGVDLFIATLPAASFSAPEVSVLSAFLSGGGNLMLVGENANSNFTAGNTAINQTLLALGSTMSIFIPTPFFDTGVQVASGPGRIAVDPFTAGVSQLTFGAPSRVIGGTQLVFGSGGEAFFAYEVIGGATVVPLPAGLPLLAGGLGLIGVILRRHRAAR